MHPMTHQGGFFCKVSSFKLVRVCPSAHEMQLQGTSPPGFWKKNVKPWKKALIFLLIKVFTPPEVLVFKNPGYYITKAVIGRC